MSAKGRFKYDETKLRPGQREAADLLIEREFTPKKERKTLDEIADEIGTSRRTLYEWNNHDTNFIAYKNKLVSEVMDSRLPMVYAKVLESIENGSMKAAEMYLKRIGDLDTKSEITLNDNRDNLTVEERLKALQERLQDDSEK